MTSQIEVQTTSTGIPFRALEFRDARLYIFSAAFISLDVLAPWLTHHFGGVQAGSMFLPMFFFILLAGLLGGWRAGLLVGLFTPLASFGASGMPLLPVLPQITIGCVLYGLIAGLLRGKFHLRIIWALIGAMIVGWLARLGFITAVFLIYGGEVSPLTYMWSVVLLGLPGLPFN
jgi:niacin transporter